MNGAFAPEQIYSAFGCTGGNVSPQLAWSGAPEGTGSFVLTMYDPDAPTGTFTHWLVWNIDPTLDALPAGEVPPTARQ